MKVSIFLLFARAHTHTHSTHGAKDEERIKEWMNEWMLIHTQRASGWHLFYLHYFPIPFVFTTTFTLASLFAAHTLRVRMWVCGCVMWMYVDVSVCFVFLVLSEFRIKLWILLCHRYIQSIHTHSYVHSYVHIFAQCVTWYILRPFFEFVYQVSLMCLIKCYDMHKI